MHPFAFKFKRKYPRYHLVDLPDLQGGIGRIQKSVRLVTLGMGGCAFLSKAGRMLYPPLRVECSFQMTGVLDPISIRGDLLYSFTSTKQDEEASYYGIEFIEEDRGLLLPVIRKLEELAASSPHRVRVEVPTSD